MNFSLVPSALWLSREALQQCSESRTAKAPGRGCTKHKGARLESFGTNLLELTKASRVGFYPLSQTQSAAWVHLIHSTKESPSTGLSGPAWATEVYPDKTTNAAETSAIALPLQDAAINILAFLYWLRGGHRIGSDCPQYSTNGHWEVIHLFFTTLGLLDRRNRR